MEPQTNLSLRIVIERPPAGIDYALQKGRGSACETVQTQRSTGKNLSFDFEVSVKPGKSPSFSGPFVQGAAGDKFVYVNIGTYAGQKNTEWARRLKVPLEGITSQMASSGRLLTATIPGTAKDGAPSCAYIWRKQLASNWGWKVAKR